MAGFPAMPNALAPQHQMGQPIVPGHGQTPPPGFAVPGMTQAQGPNGGTPAPAQGGVMGYAQQLLGGIGDYRNALMDWRGQRPDHQGFTGTPQDWHSQITDWRQQRPDLFGYMHGGAGGPTMTPGGGQTGAPLQGPNPQVGMVPGVPGSMGLNPNPQPPVQAPPAYQFPTY